MPETIDEIKKYIGPFSGPQMDQIFYEILNYTSERYAKGTANSLPVAPGTPGYQDNSLYYKNQAQTAAANATSSANAAANNAQAAADDAETAQEAAETATSSATAAANSEAAAAQSASEAATSAEAASIALKLMPTINISGGIASFSDGGDDVPVVDLKINLDIVQPGTGDPSPTNIRPIYPIEAVTIYRTGKNILYFPDLIATATQNGDTVTISQGSNTRPIVSVGKGVTLTWTRENYIAGSGTTGLRIDCLDENKNLIDTFTMGSAQKTIAGVYFIHAEYGSLSGGATIVKPQIEVGSTATAYQRYTGQLYIIDFGNNVVYGGEVDVIKGVLTATRAAQEMGSLNWNYSSSEQFYAVIANLKTGYPTREDYVPIVCSMYATASNPGAGQVTNGKIGTGSSGGNSNNTVVIKDDNYTTITTFKEAVTGQYIVYDLATPLTIQLSPTVVRTLLGDNTIFSDAGAIDLTYKADLGLYIDEHVAELQALILDH